MSSDRTLGKGKAQAPRKKVIGILGGLGPKAHIEFERLLLEKSAQSQLEQNFPAWITVSMPSTPDRTKAICEGGESPLPTLVRGMQVLEGHADFAVIACVTAHHYLSQIQDAVDIPIVNVVAETIRFIENQKVRGPIGLLATLGTLKSRIFQNTAEQMNSTLQFISPLDLSNGERLQEGLVMAPIFGTLNADGSRTGGFKTTTGGTAHLRQAKTMLMAVEVLRKAGAKAVVAGCTEIPAILGGLGTGTTLVINPLEVAAKVAVEIADGERGV